MSKQRSSTSKLKVRAIKEEGRILNVVIETPKGSRNKYKYVDKSGMFKLSRILPAGAVFPFDFGFVPETLAPDGDPLDVLLLMDEPAFPGCVVPARVIGNLRAEQTEEGEAPERNDRLLAVAVADQTYSDVQSWQELNPNLIKEIEHFFVSYHQVQGTEFVLQGIADPAEAWDVVTEARRKGTKRSRSAA